MTSVNKLFMKCVCFRVLYVSIHRHDCGKYFPCGCVGSRTHTGKGAGEGYNVNIPWNNVRIKDTFIPIPFSLKPSITTAMNSLCE